MSFCTVRRHFGCCLRIASGNFFLACYFLLCKVSRGQPFAKNVSRRKETPWTLVMPLQKFIMTYTTLYTKTITHIYFVLRWFLCIHIYDYASLFTINNKITLLHHLYKISYSEVGWRHYLILSFIFYERI